MDEAPKAPAESDGQRFGRELIEILNEIRVALPGVQMLFGFQLMVPFTTRFADLSAAQRGVFYAGLVSTFLASMLLIAPSVYHRLHWRREIADKERMLREFTRFAVAASAFLAVAMTSVLGLITDFLFHDTMATWAVTASAGAATAGVWFWLPMSRSLREKRQHPILRNVPPEG